MPTGRFDYEIRHQFRGETYHLVKKLLGEEVARVRCHDPLNCHCSIEYNGWDDLALLNLDRWEDA